MFLMVAIFLSVYAINIAAAGLPMVLFLVWATWLALQLCNFRLTRMGMVEQRFRIYPSLINSTRAHVRMIWHLVHNWSPVAMTTMLAWLTSGEHYAHALPVISLVSVAVVWCWFNWLHRRFNRLRNLGLTSGIATVLIAANVPHLAG